MLQFLQRRRDMKLEKQMEYNELILQMLELVNRSTEIGYRFIKCPTYICEWAREYIDDAVVFTHEGTVVITRPNIPTFAVTCSKEGIESFNDNFPVLYQNEDHLQTSTELAYWIFNMYFKRKPFKAICERDFVDEIHAPREAVISALMTLESEGKVIRYISNTDTTYYILAKDLRPMDEDALTMSIEHC